MSGLFATFNIAKRGMFTQQKAIDVTSHNIANANTEGYSRQRAVIQTTTPFGMPSMNNAAEPGQIGTGSEVSTIERVRDAFLDYQVRNETSTSGTYTARDKFLSEVENIFNEPSDTGLSTLIGKFFDGWQQLAKQPQSSNARTVVAQQSEALADELNHSYTQLKNLKENTQMVIKDTVANTNDILNQLDQLNQQIISVKVAGQEPNDLMDKRDLLLDKLSNELNISIDKKNFDGINLQQFVDTSDSSATTPPTDTADHTKAAYLVKASPNDPVSRFSYIKDISDDSSTNTTGPYTLTLTYYKKGDTTSQANMQTIKINNIQTKQDLQKIKGQIDECRVVWADRDGIAIDSNGKEIADGSSIDASSWDQSVKLFKPSSGEFKGYMSVQSDIDGYMDQLNKLAKTLAFSVNALHSGQTTGNVPTSTNPPNGDYVPFFVNNSVAKYTTTNGKSVLYDSSTGDTTNLKKVLDGESDITAENISVNKQILEDVMQIKTRTNDDKYATESQNIKDGDTDGSRALSIAQLRQALIKVQYMGDSVNSRADLFDPTKGGNTLNGLEFKDNAEGMTMDNYFKDTVDKLGIQEQEAKRIVTNQETLLAGYQESRDATSGVSLDEEMANLVQFQHAYQANAKVISTVDELLDVVINGLKK